jgi:prephenate dehydrogenase
MKLKPKICIIGLGRFGTLAAAILKPHFSVSAIDINSSEATEKAEKLEIKLVSIEQLGNFDAVVLSVPISETEKMIKKIAPYLKKGSLLVDTCSVKTLPCRWMKKYLPKGVEILGTHPMFGPVTSKFDLEKQAFQLEGLQIVLSPVRISGKKLESIKTFLGKLRLKIIETTPKNHDKQNAKTLSLVHFLGRALVASDITEQEIFTPGYGDLLKIIPHTTSDNWQLFFDMHNFNLFSAKMRETFLQNCDELEFKIAKSNGADELNSLRNVIDVIDRKFFTLLARRFETVEKIGKLKQKEGVAVQDKKREDEIIKDKIKKLKLDPKLVGDIYKILFNYAYAIQKKTTLKKIRKN